MAGGQTRAGASPSVRAWRAIVAIIMIVIGLSALVEACVDKFDSTQPEFFATCAQVGPVFGLALFVDIGVVMRPALEASPSVERRATVRILVFTNLAMLLLSEGGALYATGTKMTSSFLAALVILPLLVQVGLLVDMSYYRAGAHRLATGKSASGGQP